MNFDQKIRSLTGKDIILLVLIVIAIALLGMTVPLMLKPPPAEFGTRINAAAGPQTLIHHICTADQMTKAQNEALWYTSHSGYRDSFCYETAIIRNCQLRPDAKGESK